MTDTRRTYYDHEPAYQQIEASGGQGWEDLHPDATHERYAGMGWFFDSPHCPQLSPDLSVIDLGCGGGQVSLMFAARGCTVTGVEFSETAVAMARRNAQAAGLAATFVVGDCLTLEGLPDAHFDLAVDHHVLHCVVGAEDRARFLASALRVLKPGGLFFSESMSAEGVIDMAHYQIDPQTRIVAAQNRYFVLRDELDAELLEAGFEIVVTHRRIDPDDPPSGEMLLTIGRRRLR